MKETIYSTAQNVWVSSVVAVTIAFIGMVLLLWASMRVETTENPVALVFPPGSKEVAMLNVVALAEGKPIQFSGLSNVLIAKFDSEDISQILEKTGALMALDPNYSGLCRVNEGLNK